LEYKENEGTREFSRFVSTCRKEAGVNALILFSQAIKNPDAAAKRKIQRNAIKRESRKRKARDFA